LIIAKVRIRIPRFAPNALTQARVWQTDSH
jgi:hypothetical protein